jgi:hypothetical protein
VKPVILTSKTLRPGHFYYDPQIQFFFIGAENSRILIDNHMTDLLNMIKLFQISFCFHTVQSFCHQKMPDFCKNELVSINIGFHHFIQ